MLEALKIQLSDLVLSTVKNYHILDTLPEKEYDDITFLASMICDTPISVVTILDERRQFFKSNIGIDVKETPLEYSICIHAIRSPEDIFLVQDARLDERFADNPMVLGYPNVVFYAGVTLKSEEGTPIGTLCIIDDKPRELTHNQIRSLKSLANQAQRLLDLRRNNFKLKEAKNLLKIHSEQMEDFAYMAAHELQAPLNLSKSFLSLMDEKNYNIWNEEDKEIINHISGSLERMGYLISDLLAYAQISGSSIIYTKTNLRELISKVFLNISLDPVNEIIIFDIPEGSEFMFPQTALQIIFHNLLANSLKFIEENTSPKILIKAKAKDGMWIFSVKDNGIGISKLFQDKIFQPFIRAHNSSQYNGNGFGLASCKKIIEKHGGKIWVEPNGEVGSTFYFSMAKPIHILLVEDSEGDILLTTEALQESKLKNHISIAKDGIEAITILEKASISKDDSYPDLVLLDINLPKKNGHEVLAYLRNNPETSDLPLIMISTSSSEVDYRLSLENKATAYLTKPLEAEAFDLAASKVCDKWAHIINQFSA